MLHTKENLQRVLDALRDDPVLYRALRTALGQHGPLLSYKWRRRSRDGDPAFLVEWHGKTLQFHEQIERAIALCETLGGPVEPKRRPLPELYIRRPYAPRRSRAQMAELHERERERDALRAELKQPRVVEQQHLPPAPPRYPDVPHGRAGSEYDAEGIGRGNVRPGGVKMC